MKNQIKNIIAGAAVLGVTSLANAIPTMTISDGVNTVTIVDNVGADINPLAGAVSYNGSVGVWSLIINTGLTKPILGSANAPTMDLAIQASSTTGGSLTVTFSDTGFTLSPGAVLATISGHVVNGAQESVAYQVLANSQNVVGTGSVIANIPSQGMPVLASATGSLNGLGSAYSLTEVVQISSNGSTTTSIDAGFQPVPDGGMTMAMLGFGLVAVETARRKLVKA